MYPPAKYDFYRSDDDITCQEGFFDSVILDQLLLCDVSRYMFNAFPLKSVESWRASPVPKYQQTNPLTSTEHSNQQNTHSFFKDMCIFQIKQHPCPQKNASIQLKKDSSHTKLFSHHNEFKLEINNRKLSWKFYLFENDIRHF